LVPSPFFPLPLLLKKTKLYMWCKLGCGFTAFLYNTNNLNSRCISRREISDFIGNILDLSKKGLK
jgi:hypothetical protein